jgi:hypothetical protein
MRNTFEQQTSLDIKPIGETPVLLKSRDAIPSLVKALLMIYNTEKYRNQILGILEDKILAGKKKTGRTGLNLWQIFVLAQFRLALNLNYDRLHHMTFSDSVLRQLIGIESESGFKREEISYQRIIDNVQLLDDKTLRKINDVIVSFGHDVFKKKEAEALRVKTDSFVVESNVHFPTDYNLLWDSARKAMDTISWFINKYPNIEHWRKLNNWYKILKNLSRSVGQASSGGGKGKDKRMKYAANKYLTKARAFRDKLKASQNDLPIIELIDMANIISLERFIELLNKHIDLVDRRIIKGENIPHQEKLFSIFEQYTEWITKGKRRPSVELGKKLSITTDHFGLILDYVIMENESDSQIVQSTANRVLSKFAIKSWSFDKGYWHKDNKELLSLFVEELIMPKKGKPNKQEIEEEHTPNFKKQRNKHSAVESNINELEHRGLDRCPDKGFYGFKRYIGIGIAAYNLRRIGKELIDQDIKKQKKNKLRIAKLAA